LADLGAEVIRVERPQPQRERNFFDEADLHRNKKSVVLDLQQPRGIEILNALVSRADVVIENYRPDVKHRLGIDYETLSRANPRIIYASISGFGQSGPYRDRAGYDQIIQGMSGIMSLTGTDESGPLRVGIPIADLLAGYMAAIGILAALVERASSGRGQWIETSLLASLVGSLSFQAGRYLNLGEVPAPVGNHHPLVSPMGVFPAKDGVFNIAVGNEEMWARFCDAIERRDLSDDQRFDSNTKRVEHRVLLNQLLESVLATRSVSEWVERLNRAGVACGPIYRLDQVFEDPQVAHLGLVHELAHPVWGVVRLLGLPVTLHRTPAKVTRPAPLAGEHTREVLERLGYPAPAIDALVAEGVVREGQGIT
jgi:crotonobetainyl-CoA:carnitine CoA-transferase CaiB-like acyl-CoA transferase